MGEGAISPCLCALLGLLFISLSLNLFFLTTKYAAERASDSVRKTPNKPEPEAKTFRALTNHCFHSIPSRLPLFSLSNLQYDATAGAATYATPTTPITGRWGAGALCRLPYDPDSGARGHRVRLPYLSDAPNAASGAHWPTAEVAESARSGAGPWHRSHEDPVALCPLQGHPQRSPWPHSLFLSSVWCRPRRRFVQNQALPPSSAATSSGGGQRGFPFFSFLIFLLNILSFSLKISI